MSLDIDEKPVATFPKSVQPGIPRLTIPQAGWKTYRFKDLLEVVSRPVQMHDDDEYDLVTVKRSRGGIEKRATLYGAQISVKSQFRIEDGDFLISKRQIVHGACAIVTKEFSGSIVSNEYAVLRCKPDLDLNFLQYLAHSIYFQQTCFHSSIGVHVEKMIFKLEKWLDFQINIPSREEQKRIAQGFLSIDNKLGALKKKKASLEEFKSGLMQRLFSQELRFTRDDGTDFPDWEERVLGELGKTFGGLSGKSAEDFGEGLPYVTYRQIFSSAVVDFSQCGLVKVFKGERQNKIQKGDVLITASSETPEEVGFSSVVLSDPEEIYLNSFSFGYRNSGVLSPEFSVHLFRSPSYRSAVTQLAQGSTRFNISKVGFLNISLPTPHPEEQRKIADALTALDAKIAAVADQITQMETFKKGLLQQMFV